MPILTSTAMLTVELMLILRVLALCEFNLMTKRFFLLINQLIHRYIRWELVSKGILDYTKKKSLARGLVIDFFGAFFFLGNGSFTCHSVFQ